MVRTTTKYYVEEPISRGIIEDTKIEGTLDYTINLCEFTNASTRELFHFRRVLTPICLQNLLSFSHLPTRKMHNKKPLIDYS
jgi:hypothetical protein